MRKLHSKNQLQEKEAKQQMTQAESALTFDNIAEPDRWICNIPTRKVTDWFTLKEIKRQAVFTKCYEMYFFLLKFCNHKKVYPNAFLIGGIVVTSPSQKNATKLRCERSIFSGELVKRSHRTLARERRFLFHGQAFPLFNHFHTCVYAVYR